MTYFAFAAGFAFGAMVGIGAFIIAMLRFAGSAGGTIHHRVEHVEVDPADAWKSPAADDGDES